VTDATGDSRPSARPLPSPKGWIVAGCTGGAICAWTIDDAGEMHRLLEAYADGLARRALA
jgi:hypothetical protein